MLIQLFSNEPVAEVAAAVQEAAKAHQFGVLHVHDLRQTLNKKGLDFSPDCLVIEVCQPQQALEVLQQDLSIATALPCRIAVYQEHGRTVVATLKPTSLIAMFGAAQLADVAQAVEDSLLQIMNQAVSGPAFVRTTD